MPLPLAELSADIVGRSRRLIALMEDRELSGVVLFNRTYVQYYSGFAFIPTERPIAFVLSRQGERALFVPRLELEHAQANAAIDRVEAYIEYPHDPHPMQMLSQLLSGMGITTGMHSTIGADENGYPWVFGYRGVPLSLITGRDVIDIRGDIEDQMMIKSPVEIALVQESCYWGGVAHRLLQDYTRVGLTETEVTRRATDEATRLMLEHIGPDYRSGNETYYGAIAGYRGQIGRNGALPHALPGNITFEPGDVLVTGAASALYGYNSELERTMFMGEPNERQRTLFEHMLALQTLAIEAIRPGIPCAHVDHLVRAYYEKYDLMPYWKHHVGHAIGLRYHEGPFLDIGDPTIIQPGMIFTVEPGLYAPDLGGFRHSDTILVTETGFAFMTDYPRDWESLTLPV